MSKNELNQELSTVASEERQQWSVRRRLEDIPFRPEEYDEYEYKRIWDSCSHCDRESFTLYDLGFLLMWCSDEERAAIRAWLDRNIYGLAAGNTMPLDEFEESSEVWQEMLKAGSR